jgi:creatinine amidohydrolase
MTDLDTIRQLDAKALRAHLKDGNWGGVYQRPDEEMLEIWRVGVEETRELLAANWA